MSNKKHFNKFYLHLKLLQSMGSDVKTEYHLWKPMTLEQHEHDQQLWRKIMNDVDASEKLTTVIDTLDTMRQEALGKSLDQGENDLW